MEKGATDCVLSSIFLDLIPLDVQISLIIPIGSVGSSISVVGGGEFPFASSGGGWVLRLCFGECLCSNGSSRKWKGLIAQGTSLNAIFSRLFL
ncbi:hypothetical protein SDJN02_00012, partial [Cucurbita argyrosperma subsp. argyrosperma]